MPIIPNLDNLASNVKQQIDAIRAMYDEKRASYNAIGEEITRIRNAPPDRAAVAELLAKVADGWYDLHEKDLRARLEQFVRDPNGAGEIADRWLGGMTSRVEPSDWLIVPLLREQLRAGAKALAQSLPWPDTDVDSAERVKLIEKLEARQQDVMAVMLAIDEEAKKLGVNLRRVAA